MLSLEKLSNSNLDKFKKLSAEKLNFKTYDKDFFKYYESESFFSKIILKKFVKLFVHNEKVIGYIWYNIPFENPIKVWSLYVKPSYLEIVDKDILWEFDKDMLIYEELNNEAINSVLRKLGFCKYRETFLMKLVLFDQDKKGSERLFTKITEDKDVLEYTYSNRFIHPNIAFKRFKIGKDEKLRCDLQTDIFHDKMRAEIDVSDIENDIKQEYYIDDLSIFLMMNNSAIGYGQVIYNRGRYTVVNFGIVSVFRGKGFGELLLNHIINECIDRNILDLYIRVDKNNIKAINLYNKCGFKYEYSINNWKREK